MEVGTSSKTQAQTNTECALIVGIVIVLVPIIHQLSGGKNLSKFLLQSFVYLTFGLLLFYFIKPLLQKLWKKVSKEGHVDNYEEIPREKFLQNETESRDKIQEAHEKKANSYNERILKPREESKRIQREEKFAKFAGPAWKGKGETLGGNEENKKFTPGTSKDAIDARKLPEHVTNPPKPPQKEQNLKKRIVLPEEPTEGAKNTIVIALRTPMGRIFKRRFTKDTKLQVLLDYMTTIGYHSKFYTVSTTFPRRSLKEHCDSTFEDVGILHDSAVNIEELEENENNDRKTV